MDAIGKALKKLDAKERERVKEILAKVSSGTTQGLDIKKLKGRSPHSLPAGAQKHFHPAH